MTKYLAFCTMVYMTVAEFRKTIKTQLDKAVRGKVVTIERGGVVFTVTADVSPKCSRARQDNDSFTTLLKKTFE